MKATAEDRKRLETEAQSLADQLRALGALQVILFGSLARGQVSLFSDIDLLALFDRDLPSHELTRWVYQNIDSGEAVDILAYSQAAFARLRERPFFLKILSEGKVLYGPAS